MMALLAFMVVGSGPQEVSVLRLDCRVTVDSEAGSHQVRLMIVDGGKRTSASFEDPDDIFAADYGTRRAGERKWSVRIDRRRNIRIRARGSAEIDLAPDPSGYSGRYSAFMGRISEHGFMGSTGTMRCTGSGESSA